MKLRGKWTKAKEDEKKRCLKRCRDDENEREIGKNLSGNGGSDKMNREKEKGRSVNCCLKLS